QAAAELQRLQAALRAAAREARENQQTVSDKVGRQYGAIFAAHALLIEDPALLREAERLIRDQAHTAEYAVSRVIRRHAQALENPARGALMLRAADLFDIEKLILRNPLGQRSELVSHLKEPVVVLARDLTPSETASLDRSKVYAFATEAGGRASHTAIMAGVLEIPAVVGIGRFLNDVSGGDEVIVAGNGGLVILNPDEEPKERYEQPRKSLRRLEPSREELRELPAETRCGTRVQLFGNIEFPEEAAHCVDRGADGVGLYRTE